MLQGGGPSQLQTKTDESDEVPNLGCEPSDLAFPPLKLAVEAQEIATS